MEGKGFVGARLAAAAAAAALIKEAGKLGGWGERAHTQSARAARTHSWQRQLFCRSRTAAAG